jgi:hypothetical protein
MNASRLMLDRFVGVASVKENRTKIYDREW